MRRLAGVITGILRIQQWYKNLVIFLALFFTKNLFNPELLLAMVMGFISLCMVSSSGYIINDILDIDEDRVHPDKRKRPIASGKVSVRTAALISGALFTASVAVAYSLSARFMVFPLLLMASSLLYSLWLKNIAIVDIHVIALNFLLRAVSGAVLIGVYTSPWLITAIYFMALFMAVGKRRAELGVLNHDAVGHKRVYGVYNGRLLDMMVVVITAVFLFTYSLYTFLVHEKPYPYMMLTIPFVSFMVFRYLYFISINHVIARKTHYVFLDGQMMASLFMWLATSFIVMYYLIEL